jgi:MFS family permease
MQVWLTFVVGAFSGRMLDAGLFLPTFCVGVVLQVTGIFLMSLSTKYWQLVLTQGIMTGLGGGIFFCPAIGLVATYFSKRRAIAVGITSTGNAAGGMIYPVLARELLGRIGFAWTARVLGLPCTRLWTVC